MIIHLYKFNVHNIYNLFHVVRIYVLFVVLDIGHLKSQIYPNISIT